jgi:uncharacterized protein (DUF433 family)
MSAITEIGTLIIRTPGICGGRPRIEGSRITVENIVIDFRAGKTAEEILQHKPYLSLAKIYTALAYYYANQEEIDDELLTGERAWKQIEASFNKGDKSIIGHQQEGKASYKSFREVMANGVKSLFENSKAKSNNPSYE